MREKKKSRRGSFLALLLITAILGSLWGMARKDSALRQSAPAAVKNAVLRCARQCYAVEGSYPESLSYLEENYGLRINTEDYFIVYDVFASNVPPEVRVAERPSGVK